MIEIVGPRLTSATHGQEQGGKDIAVNRTNIRTSVFSPAQSTGKTRLRSCEWYRRIDQAKH